MSVLARSVGNAFRKKVRTAAVVAVTAGGTSVSWSLANKTDRRFRPLQGRLTEESLRTRITAGAVAGVAG